MNTINLEIRESVNQRCEMLKDNQRRMINSILEKPFKKIAIDRILINEAKGKDFFNDSDEVLEKTAEHFSKQFKKRNFQEEVMSDEWKEIYKPITRIKEGVYRNLSNRITKEEWVQMLLKLKANTAPGISGIGYMLIKQANTETQKVFRNFASICIAKGEIPLKWKIGQTYPISKDTEWGYDLNNIRPIVLLETFRKCVTKIFTTRLEKIIRENNLLEGPNFAELVRSSTKNPIHILSMIIEEAKEKNQEL